ncbi:MAG: chemotaxis protein CheW [Cyanobacteria bacterium P01_F01_bin.42]
MTNQVEFDAEFPQEEASDFQNLVQNPEGDLHLRFFLDSDTEFALPAMGIREVLSIASDQITPVPNVSPYLLGILNLRGQVVWVADISQFLGEPKPMSIDQGELSVIVIESGDVMLGLAVASIKGMEWLNAEHLRPSEQTNDSLTPFLVGEWAETQDGETPLQLIDSDAIVRSDRWAA